MSIEINELKCRLRELNNNGIENGVSDHSILVTFDDGWSDVLQLSDFFEETEKLQPVLFLTRTNFETHFSHYQGLWWCDSWSAKFG